MTTKENIHNFIRLLEAQSVNGISALDFTLNELEAFVNFLEMLDTFYNSNRHAKDFSDFHYAAANYEQTISNAQMDNPDDLDWLDEQFFSLKLKAEDIAAEMVLDDPCKYVISNLYTNN